MSQYLNKLGESWTKGDPELEIHTARNDPTDEVGDGNIIRCVSESRAGEGSYVQNDNRYDGDVMLATQAQLDGARDLKGLMFIVYEDDDTTCTIKDSSDALESSIAAVKAVKDGKDAITDEDCGNLCKTIALAESSISLIEELAGIVQTNDDLIGEIVGNSCQTNGFTGEFEVRRDTGVKGCANLRAN